MLACAAGAAALRAAALPLDRRLEAIEIEEDNRRFLRLALSGGLVIALLLGALAADAPRRISDARATFSEGRYMDYSDDLRTRLTSAVDNGRIDNWRVALDGFDASPLHGTGAGTYRITWDADRPAPPIKVNDGHSLYLEVLSELGVVGLVLLLVALGTPLVVGAARLGGPERHAHGAFLAAGVMLLAHAGDRLGLGDAGAVRVVLRGGRRRARGARGAARRARTHAADRRRAGGARARAHARAVRVLAGRRWTARVNAFARRDCDVAIDAALTATERFGTRPEPWMVLGYCDARLGQFELARRAMDAARSRDPDNWQYAYGQAIVYGVSGRRSAAVRREAALRLNPLDPLARALVRDLRAAKTEARRREVTRRAGIPLE